MRKELLANIVKFRSMSSLWKNGSHQFDEVEDEAGQTMQPARHC